MHCTFWQLAYAQYGQQQFEYFVMAELNSANCYDDVKFSDAFQCVACHRRLSGSDRTGYRDDCVFACEGLFKGSHRCGHLRGDEYSGSRGNWREWLIAEAKICCVVGH